MKQYPITVLIICFLTITACVTIQQKVNIDMNAIESYAENTNNALPGNRVKSKKAMTKMKRFSKKLQAAKSAIEEHHQVPQKVRSFFKTNKLDKELAIHLNETLVSDPFSTKDLTDSLDVDIALRQHAYRIEIGDMLNAFNIVPANSDYHPYVRGYIGIESDGLHLYFTPVDANNHDVILGHMYDLTTPCPATCDESSPYYHAYN